MINRCGCVPDRIAARVCAVRWIPRHRTPASLGSLTETESSCPWPFPWSVSAQGARIGQPSSPSETGTTDREYGILGIEDPELDVAEQQLALTDLDEDNEDDEELPASGQSPLEADPTDLADQRRR